MLPKSQFVEIKLQREGHVLVVRVAPHNASETFQPFEGREHTAQFNTAQLAPRFTIAGTMPTNAIIMEYASVTLDSYIDNLKRETRNAVR